MPVKKLEIRTLFINLHPLQNNISLENTLNDFILKKMNNISFCSPIHNINANNININNNDNIKKNKKYLTNFVINYENNSNNKSNEFEIIAPSINFNLLKKNDMINALEKINFNTIENKDLSEKFGMDLKFNKKL